MKLGIDELRVYSKGVQWYDRKSVRDQELLTPEELKYVRSWTISPLGYGSLVYIFKRNLPDIATVYVVTYLYSEVYDAYISPVTLERIQASPSILLLWILSLLFLFAQLYNTYFLLRHSRRLSWNNGRYVNFFSRRNGAQLWNSVQELKDSENKFFKYSTIPSLILVTLFLLMIVLFSPVPN